jgi:DNA repair protein RecO (recombination protein O)
MTEERATGIILRVRPLTETSLIAHWLTASQGRIATVAKGGRRPKSPFRGKLDLFYRCEFSFARSRRSDLHTLREVQLRETRPLLRQDLGRLHQAAYAVRLIEHTSESDTPVPALFTLLDDFLGVVTSEPLRALTVMAFELRLLAELGLSPDVEASRLSPGARRIVQRCGAIPLSGLRQLALSQEQVRELARFLEGFLAYHVGKVPGNRGEALAAAGETTTL